MQVLDDKIRVLIKPMSATAEVSQQGNKIEIKIPGQDSSLRTQVIQQLASLRAMVKLSEVIDSDFFELDLGEELAAAELVDTPVDIFDSPQIGAEILDVRHPDEVANEPLLVGGKPVRAMPYFHIQQKFPELSSDTTYLLYCDRGVMSRLHAEMLIESGYRNVAVYQP